MHGEGGSDEIDFSDNSTNSNPRIKVGFDEKKHMYIWDGDFETFKDFCQQDLGFELLKTTGEDGDRKMSIKTKGATLTFYKNTKTIQIQGSDALVVKVKLKSFLSHSELDQPESAEIESSRHLDFGVGEENSHIDSTQRLYKEISDMKKEISNLWNIIQTPNQSEKQDCQCSVEVRRLEDQNRSLKDRLEEVEREKDALLLSLSLLAAKTHTPASPPTMDNSIIELHTQQEPSASTTTNDALTDNRAPKACTGISMRSSSADSGKSATIPLTSSVKPIKGKKPKVLIIGDSMIKEIEAEKLSKTQSITKTCIPGATVVKIRDQLVAAFIEDSGYDHVIIHAGTNDLADSQQDEVIERVKEMAEKVTELSSSTKITISSIITKREPDVNNKISHINESLKSVCVTKGWTFIDNSRIEIAHLKNKGIHLNKDGVKLFAANIIRQALNPKHRSKGKNNKNFQDPVWKLAKVLSQITRGSAS